MEQKGLVKIPFVVHQAAMFRKERIIKRLVAALVLSNFVFGFIVLNLFKKR